MKDYVEDTPDATHCGHKVVYDDGDVRWYPREKMEGREYELYKLVQEPEPESEAALLKGWNVDVPPPNREYPAGSVWVPPADPPIAENWAARPSPMSYGMSLYLLDMVRRRHLPTPGACRRSTVHAATTTDTRGRAPVHHTRTRAHAHTHTHTPGAMHLALASEHARWQH